MKTSNKHIDKMEIGVKSLLYCKNKGFLIIRRNPTKYKGKKDLWDIPGGRIKRGYSLLNNLKREIKEETGLSRETDTQLLSAQDIFWKNQAGENVHLVRITYISRIQNIRADFELPHVKLSHEHTEYRWVPLGDLMKLRGLDVYLKAILKDKSCMSFIKSYISK